MKKEVVIFWFRRDLRLDDNHALFRALKSGYKVLPIFIFDKNILQTLNKKDKRVALIHRTIQQLNEELFNQYHSGIEVYFDYPINVFHHLLEKYYIRGVYANKDYEPYAIKRDSTIKEFLYSKEVPFYLMKDHVIFEERDILKPDGSPFHVYTHYSKAWKQKFFNEYNGKIFFYPTTEYLSELLWFEEKQRIYSLNELGFECVDFNLRPLKIDEETLKHYSETRDYIFLENGTTHASVYLRFGMVSTRYLIAEALKYSIKFLDELIWREFYQMILFHYPQSAENNFKQEYKIEWENNERWFELWKSGRTGFPIIDAAMHELNTTGYMHNRCRMIVANFLTKILLIDWRWGEKYFAEKLMDYEIAS
ncbi:MAG: DNA photolyase family protein, partial [Bacteroidia bacterium]|nr:DNA photolyase family protein [Bacteroidia bacterium]